MRLILGTSAWWKSQKSNESTMDRLGAEFRKGDNEVGLNLTPYEITSSGNAIEVDWFDSLRYVGDEDFLCNVRWYRHSKDLYDYFRPLDFVEAKEWVKSNIVESNQPRLLNLLDNMESNPNLWAYFGY
jgi:hypothetical protein